MPMTRCTYLRDGALEGLSHSERDFLICSTCRLLAGRPRLGVFPRCLVACFLSIRFPVSNFAVCPFLFILVLEVVEVDVCGELLSVICS